MSNRKNIIIGRFFGLGAGLAYGLSAALIRQGVGNMTAPLVGAAVAMTSGTIVLFAIGARGIDTKVINSRKSILFLLGSGTTSACGIVASYFALSLAPVVIVSPLQNTMPLFTLLWSGLFLQKMERITPRLVIGSFLVVTGVILITLGRS